MAHQMWVRWAAHYAEGVLRWPLTLLVEWHSRRCQPCRHLIRQEMWLWQQVDAQVFQPQEVVHTAAILTRSKVNAQCLARTEYHRYLTPVLAIAATLVVAVGGLQLRNVWPGEVRGNVVYASSSYGEMYVVGDDSDAVSIVAPVFLSDSQDAG